MSGLEVLNSVKFINLKGNLVAVLSVEDWQALIEWLETIEDIQIARKAFAQLKAAGRNRESAGWLKWDDVE
ncbi:MAG TPA: hypothetical protein DCY88_11705 [Cyanobacteria bacterium UBA11372]|nr:hypothetical protein [Cyanobacteria bacterium UBA11372]